VRLCVQVPQILLLASCRGSEHNSSRLCINASTAIATAATTAVAAAATTAVADTVMR
jgi:hypothetical protein